MAEGCTAIAYCRRWTRWNVFAGRGSWFANSTAEAGLVILKFGTDMSVSRFE